MPAELPSRRELFEKIIFSRLDPFLSIKNTPLDLPLLQKETTRRKFVIWTPAIAATTTAVFLSACGETPSVSKDLSLETPKGQDQKPFRSSSQDNEVFPERTKLSEIRRWTEDALSSLKEIEKGSYFLGQFVNLDESKINIKDFASGQKRVIEAPIKTRGPLKTVKFSPDGKRLALWYRTGGYDPGREYTFLLGHANDELRKIDERELNVPFGQTAWSNDGRWLAINAFPFGLRPGEPLNKGGVRLIDLFNGGTIYDQLGGGEILFSPNSQFFAHNSLSQLYIFNLEARAVTRYPRIDGWKFFWSPDGQTLASISQKRLTLRNFQTGKEKIISQNANFIPFGFSPGGKRLLYLEGNRYNQNEKAELIAFNLETEAKIRLAYPLNQSDWVYFSGAFFKSEHEIVLATSSEDGINVYEANLDNGALLGQQLIAKPDKNRHLDFLEFLNADWFISLYSSNYPDRRVEFYLASLKTGRLFPLEGAFFEAMATEGVPSWDFQLNMLEENTIFDDGKKFYLFEKGIRYGLDSAETKRFLNAKSVSLRIPQRTVEQIPESLNKLEFKGGDILLDKEKKDIWYLRNNERFQIADLGKFQKNVQFNRQRREVPAWLLDKIPEGHDPAKETEKFFIKNKFMDWDGHFIEHQREGSILLMFVKGWKTTGLGELGYPKTIETLGKYGWNDGRMAEFTYKAKQNSNGGLELFPYQPVDTSISPSLAAKYLEWQIIRYKKLLPWTKIILIAHSLGGWVAFNAALNEEVAEALRGMVLLDAPLKGIKNTLLTRVGEEILRQSWGNDVVQFLLSWGRSPNTDFMVEQQSGRLVERGIDVFSGASTDDNLVRWETAFLENSTQKLGGVSIRDKLLFSMGRLAGQEDLFGVIGDAQDLIIAHGTPTRHPAVMELVAQIVGKIG